MHDKTLACDTVVVKVVVVQKGKLLKLNLYCATLVYIPSIVLYLRPQFYCLSFVLKKKSKKRKTTNIVDLYYST